MSCWNIHNGLVELTLFDGNKIYPSAVDILSQVKHPKFSYKGEDYSPVSSLNIRFSQLGQAPKIEFSFVEDSISLILYVTRKNQTYSIPKENGIYKDYVICDDVFYYLSGSYTVIEKFLPNVQNPYLSVSQYLDCIHLLKESNVDFKDNVIFELERIKKFMYDIKY